MATLYSSQYNNAYVAVPSVKIAPGDVGGKLRIMYFDYPVTATAPSNNDIVKLGKLPKGAKVIEAALSIPDLGTVGVIELGWADSAELDSAGAVVEVASASGFLSGVDVHTAAQIIKMSGVTGAAVAGYLKEFAAEVDVQIKVTTAWDAVSGTIKGHISYVIV